MLEHGTRRLHITGITTQPTRDWTVQQARNLAADIGTRMESLRFLLRDRDSKYGEAFDTVFEAEELRAIESAPQAPRMNAHRERIIGTAVLIGEYERAFCGGQFREVVSRLNELGVQVWLPEAGGPVELDSPAHQALRSCSARRLSGKWLGLVSVCWRRCGRRPVSRAGSWAVVRPTGIAWSMVVRIRMLGIAGGVGGCRCWRRIL